MPRRDSSGYGIGINVLFAVLGNELAGGARARDSRSAAPVDDSTFAQVIGR